MKNLTLTLIATFILTGTGLASAVEADINGARPGKWTMDLDAAKELAAKSDLPIMINFSGSDWCGWCKIMETNVFSKEEWAEYAKTSLIMVLIDFPRDDSIVPKKYKERNEEMKATYGVRGFPTFVILDSDGNTELGRTKAGKQKTPEIVQCELAQLFHYRDAEVKKYADGLKKKDGETYLAIVEKLRGDKRKIAEKEEAIADANKAIEDLKADVEVQLDAARAFRTEQLGKDELKKYEQIKAEFDAAQRDLTEWMATSPERSQETQKVYDEKAARISKAAAQLAKY